MSKYSDYITRKGAEYGVRFDPSDLDPRFIPYFDSGERVRVATCGLVLTGTIGITTGWRPAFLLMRRRTDHGSTWVLGANSHVLAVKRGKGYQAL